MKKREGLRVVEIAVVLVSINLLLAGILRMVAAVQAAASLPLSCTQ